MHRRLNHPFARALLALVFSVAAAPALAVTPPAAWFYRSWQTENGLPDNYVSGVAQTEDGYLWVATKGGVLRFNGQEFVAIPPGNLPPMPSRTVRAMLRDSHDNIWLAMERGPLLGVKRDGLSIFSAPNASLRQAVLAMAEDRDGAIWMARPAGLERVKEGTLTAAQAPPDEPSGDFYGIARDRHGDIWFAKGCWVGILRDGKPEPLLTFDTPAWGVYAGAESGVWVCAGSQVFKCEEGRSAEERGQLPGHARPLTALEDHTGALWIGTAADGLFRLGVNLLERVPTSHPEVTCLSEDREGNLWAGTSGGGLNLIRPRSVTLLGRSDGLPFESLLSVSQDTEGSLWVVSQDGVLARQRQEQWELVSAATHWPGGSATCVAADRQGGVWVGTSDRGLKCFRNGTWRTWLRRDGLASDSVRSLLVAANGDVWAASDSPNSLQRLRDGQALILKSPAPLGPIRAMAEGADGTLWIGTAHGEVRRVSGSSLLKEPAVQEGIPLSVRCLLAAPDGSLWIGFAGDGLGRLKQGIYTRLTTANGLLDNFVSQVLADGEGNLWLAGNRGLSRVQWSGLNAVIDGRLGRVWARAYGHGDGLPSLQPSRDYCPTVHRASDGRLWFAMRNGLLRVEPEKLRKHSNPPAVRLEQVTVDNKVVALYDAHSPLQNRSGSGIMDLRAPAVPLCLAPGHRKLEFDFAALSFASPENVQFRYRLQGFDQQWVEAGSLRHAIYPQLAAGNYEFRVLACNNAGVWNETGVTLPLAVSPFLWDTWWFRAGALVLTLLTAGGSVFLLSRRRFRRKLSRLELRRALEQERGRIAKNIHDDLGASLTRIMLLSQPVRNNPEEAEAVAQNLEQIHSTARQLTRSMEEVVWAVNPAHDTFDGLANYLSNYAQSFLSAAGVRCRLDLPLQLPAHALSAEMRHNLFLAFKEALNNVVKHAAATEVHISLLPGQTGFVLQVEDNGRGLPMADPTGRAPADSPTRPRTGNGLKNMQSRLREIGGACEWQSAPGTGTKVTFTVTFKTNHDSHSNAP